MATVHTHNQMPTGIGLYIRGLSKSKHGTPAQAAKKAADNGVSFVAIMTAWQDVHKGKQRFLHSNGRDGLTIAKYTAAFNARGIAVWLWGFPRGGGELQYVDRFSHVTRVCRDKGAPIAGWLWDPELFYKWSRSAPVHAAAGVRGQPEFSASAGKPFGGASTRRVQAANLMSLTFDAMDEGLGLGITSYGMAKYHSNFPWDVFGGMGWGSPQLYSVGPKDVDRGITMWRNHGWEHIVPSVPTFGKKNGAAALHDHLSNFVDGTEDIKGFIFWSWRQTSPDEWRILARWAEYFDRHDFPIG